MCGAQILVGLVRVKSASQRLWSVFVLFVSAQRFPNQLQHCSVALQLRFMAGPSLKEELSFRALGLFHGCKCKCVPKRLGVMSWPTQPGSDLVSLPLPFAGANKHPEGRGSYTQVGSGPGCRAATRLHVPRVPHETRALP